MNICHEHRCKCPQNISVNGVQQWIIIHDDHMGFILDNEGQFKIQLVLLNFKTFQICINQVSVVLVKEQIHRPEEQNRESGNKSIQIQPTDLDKRIKQFNGERRVFKEWYGYSRISILKNMNLDTALTSFAKVSLKSIIQINVRYKTIRFQSKT